MQYSKDKLKKITLIEEPEKIGDKGLGQLLTLLICLKGLDNGELLLTDTVIVNEVVEKESRFSGSAKFEKGEEVILSQLLQLQLCKMSPDTSLLLAKLFREKTKRGAQAEINAFIVEKNLTENCCKNISGRKKRNDPQSYTLNDIKVIAYEFSTLSKNVFQYLTQSQCVFHGVLFERKDDVIGGKSFPYRISWGTNRIVFDGPNLYILLEAKNRFELDKKILELLSDNKKTPSMETILSKRKNNRHFDKEEAQIVIAGDTYLGEWYTKRRVARNQWDPLNEEGYDYSFEKVQHFLDEADFSIVNLEAVLVDDLDHSPLRRKKKFVLGAKAEETVQTLKKHSVDLVTLATNHTGDYGQTGVSSTIKTLKKHKLPFVGSGLTEDEALCPYRISTKAQDIFIFNGYWYREAQYVQFGMYSMGDQIGGNCLSDSFFQLIRKTKESYPDSKILVVCHWGIDFNPINKYQRVVAKQLVEAGADLIMGHGPHAIQPVERVDSIDVLYSLGNFVFNSNGEFDTHPDALPYGMVVKLNIVAKQLKATLHFLQAENHKTKWQPQEINDDDFTRILHAWGTDKLTELDWTINYETRTVTKQIW